MPDKTDILIIAPARLRGFIDALDAMKSIRETHTDARITLLARPSLIDLAGRCRYFDALVSDRREAQGIVAGWSNMLWRLRKQRFSGVYDFCGLPLLRRPAGRYFLRGASVWPVPPAAKTPDLDWMTAETDLFGLQDPYVLLLLGEEGLSASRYAALALRLARDGFQPVVLGTDDDIGTADRLQHICPPVRDLCGLTSLCDVAALARGAAAAIGGDSAALHLIALTGCPTQVIAKAHPLNEVYRAFAPRQRVSDAVRA